jgi:hypothetical protein
MENEQIKAAKRAYFKKYREDHKEKVSEQRKEWFKKNPTKRAEYQNRYWAKKAEEIKSE